MSYFIEKAARTVDGAFRQLLNDHINIGQGTRSGASTSQQSIRSFLNEERNRDPQFPRIMSSSDTDFIGGSFQRETKIWPLDDIDIYFPLDGAGLVCSQDGIVQQHIDVVSDGVDYNSPLTDTRWANNGNVSSTKLISEFKKVLERRYSRSTVSEDQQAVSVRLTLGESENADGLGFDVMPAFRLKQRGFSEIFDFNKPFYLIPDGSNGWIRTNPRLDAEKTQKLNQENNGLFRKVVRIIKYWNTEHMSGPLRSYYIELALMKRLEAANAQGQTIEHLSEGVAWAFIVLQEFLQQGSLSSFVDRAPPVSFGVFTQADKATLDDAVRLARQAYQAERDGNYSQAIQFWKDVFGADFPDAE